MKTICPKCGYQSSIDPDRIPDKGAKAKCPKCQVRFIIKKKLKDIAGSSTNRKPACPNCDSECRETDTECRKCGMEFVYIDAKPAAREEENIDEAEQAAPAQNTKEDITAEPAPADNKTVTFLTTTDLFKNIPQNDIAEVAACMKEKKASEDEVIFRESEEGTDLYILRTGTVKITIKPKEDDQDEESVQLIGPGEIFGEFAFVDAHDRSATARAQEDSHFLVFARQDFEHLCKNNPSLALIVTRNIARIIATKIRKTTRMLRDSE